MHRDTWFTVLAMTNHCAWQQSNSGLDLRIMLTERKEAPVGASKGRVS